MATITLTPAGRWRAQIRRAGRPAYSQNFEKKVDAARWARAEEARLDQERAPKTGMNVTYAELSQQYMEAVEGSNLNPSKRYIMKGLERHFGAYKLEELSKQVVLNMVQTLIDRGLTYATMAAYLSYYRVVLRQGGAVADLEDACAAALLQLEAARAILSHQRRLGRKVRRDRRPSADELTRIQAYCAGRDTHTVTPLWDIILFAMATSMRKSEILGRRGVKWEDFDSELRTIVIRNRKNPHGSQGNDQIIPLLRGPLQLGGVVIDPVEIMNRQRTVNLRKGPIFPSNPKTVVGAFREMCKHLGIKNLRFHDLRHEGVSRMFEYGMDIPQVAAVSGHQSWANLKIYTNLRPENLHKIQEKIRKSEGFTKVTTHEGDQV